MSRSTSAFAITPGKRLVTPRSVTAGTRAGFKAERVWSGDSKRAGVAPGSHVHAQHSQEPGAGPAKPRCSLGSLSGHRVAAGLVGQAALCPTNQTGGDSRFPNATRILKPARGAVTLRGSLTRGRSALGRADDALDQPVHSEDVAEAELLALGHAELA